MDLHSATARPVPGVRGLHKVRLTCNALPPSRGTASMASLLSDLSEKPEGLSDWLPPAFREVGLARQPCAQECTKVPLLLVACEPCKPPAVHPGGSFAFLQALSGCNRLPECFPRCQPASLAGALPCVGWGAGAQRHPERGQGRAGRPEPPPNPAHPADGALRPREQRPAGGRGQRGRAWRAEAHPKGGQGAERLLHASVAAKTRRGPRPNAAPAPPGRKPSARLSRVLHLRTGRCGHLL